MRELALAGAPLVLQRRIDAVFASWAERHGAVEYQFPALIDAAELGKTDYLTSFPHLATFAAALDASDDNLRRFAAGVPVDGDGRVRATTLAPLRSVLTPAACYHFYVHFQGAALTAPLRLTTVATCFRRERSYRPLERQPSFTMRELVCIGSEADVATFLDELRGEIDALVAAVALPATWQVATDAFFQPRDNPKWWMQRLEPNKHELVVDGGPALASINAHRSYFGERFDITIGGRPAFSGCVAFGLERWLGTVLERWGADAAAWPAVWR